MFKIWKLLIWEWSKFGNPFFFGRRVDGPISNKAHHKIKKCGTFEKQWRTISPTFPLGSSSLLHNHGGCLTWWLDSMLFNNPIPAFTHLPTYGTFFYMIDYQVDTQHQLQMVFIHNTHFLFLPITYVTYLFHTINYRYETLHTWPIFSHHKLWSWNQPCTQHVFMHLLTSLSTYSSTYLLTMFIHLLTVSSPYLVTFLPCSSTYLFIYFFIYLFILITCLPTSEKQTAKANWPPHWVLGKNPKTNLNGLFIMIPMPFKWVLGCFYHDPNVGVKFALAEANDSLACLLAGWKKHTAIKAKAINPWSGKRRRRAISAGSEDAQKGKDLASC